MHDLGPVCDARSYPAATRVLQALRIESYRRREERRPERLHRRVRLTSPAYFPSRARNIAGEAGRRMKIIETVRASATITQIVPMEAA